MRFDNSGLPQRITKSELQYINKIITELAGILDKYDLKRGTIKFVTWHLLALIYKQEMDETEHDIDIEQDIKDLEEEMYYGYYATLKEIEYWWRHESSKKRRVR